MGGRLSKRIQQQEFKSTQQEALLNLLVASDYLNTEIDRICAAFGITRGQYNVLRILKGVFPGGHARCDIRERMIERAPDVTRLIDRLAGRKLAERVPSESDGRLSVARITRKGINLLAQMSPAVEAFDNTLSVRLTETDCRTLSRICEKIYI